MANLRNNGNCEWCFSPTPATRYVTADFWDDLSRFAGYIADSALLLCETCYARHNRPGANRQPPVRYGLVVDLVAALEEQGGGRDRK